MKLVIVRGKEKAEIAVNSAEMTFGELKGAIQQRLQVEAAHQRLIVKGKEAKDNQSLRSLGLTRDGDKVMLLFNATYHAKTGQEQQRAESGAPSPPEPAGSVVAQAPTSGPTPSRVDLSAAAALALGAGEGDGDHVCIIHGRSSFTLPLSSLDSSTFGDVKSKIEKFVGIKTSGQNLIFKGKSRKDEEELTGAGVKSGAKIMLLFTERQHAEFDGRDSVKSVEARLCSLEKEVAAAATRIEKRLLAGGEVLLTLRSLKDTAEILSDNLAHAEVALADKVDLLERLRRLHGHIHFLIEQASGR